MSTMPICPVCGLNDKVTSNGGVKQTVGTAVGLGAGVLWAGPGAAATVVMAAAAVANPVGAGLLVVAGLAAAVGVPVGTTWLGQKIGKALDKNDGVRTYFCSREGHKWSDVT